LWTQIYMVGSVGHISEGSRGCLYLGAAGWPLRRDELWMGKGVRSPRIETGDGKVLQDHSALYLAPQHRLFWSCLHSQSPRHTWQKLRLFRHFLRCTSIIPLVWEGIQLGSLWVALVRAAWGLLFTFPPSVSGALRVWKKSTYNTPNHHIN
jgi:hypothetical protein